MAAGFGQIAGGVVAGIVVLIVLIVVAVGASAYRYIPFLITGGVTAVIYIALAFEVASFDSATDWTAAANTAVWDNADRAE